MNRSYTKKEHMPYPKIPLFDIDWTLLKGGASNKIHGDAFDFAFHTVFVQPTAFKSEIVTDGKIDTQIIFEVLKLHGVSEEEAKAKMSEALKAMEEYFIQHVDEGTYEPMPGVKGLLDELKQKDIPLGLLTGNVAAIGWEKLRRAGLKDYFSFGAFGSMAFKRVDLIKIAADEAIKALGRPVEVSELFIVGDSPLDIACARDGGIPVIAVGAGHFKSHELAHADLTLDSLKEKDKFLKFLDI